MSYLVVLLDKSMAIPGLPGSLIIYQGHLFPLKGYLWGGVLFPGFLDCLGAVRGVVARVPVSLCLFP